MKNYVFVILAVSVLVLLCSCDVQDKATEFCEKDGVKLNVWEARAIAVKDCGIVTEDYVCNENTGTMWIDLDIEKEGCNPACVINIITKEAEINWRCTGAIPEGQTDGYTYNYGNEDDDGDTVDVTGNFNLMISDKEADIGDFDSLVVTFSKARIFSSGGWEEMDLSSSSVDLTQVVGEKAISVLDVNLPDGSYNKVELHVLEVKGVVNGSVVDVKVPSNKLQITKPFVIGNDSSTNFVFDINVVKKGNKDEYNLLPVIGKSGTDQDVEEVECTVDDDCSEGETCVENECESVEEDECSSDDDCNEGEECVDGECSEIDEVECETNDDCEGNMTCAEKECVECTLDSDCGDMELCLENECEEVECKENSDCLEGRECVENECKGYACPTNSTIDCMPVVPEDLIDTCSGDYNTWITANCNVTFTY